jgi:hypothetical protein
VSLVYIEMLKRMIKVEPEERMSWKEFFEDPVLTSEPDKYRQLIEAISRQPN